MRGSAPAAAAEIASDKGTIYSGMGKPVRAEEIEKTHYWRTALDIVRSFSGVYIGVGPNNDGISIRGCKGNPLLVIDDVPLPDDAIKHRHLLLLMFDLFLLL